MRDLYQEFGCTAVIRPFTHKDEVTDQTISVTISPQYSILRVGDREYYFKLANVPGTRARKSCKTHCK
jgi:hypothetical protein